MMSQLTRYSDIATKHKQNTTAGNANISNVLSQIQDDGPAYADSHADLQRRDNLINIRSDKRQKTTGRQQSAELNNEKEQPDLSVAFIPDRKLNRVRAVRNGDAAASGLKKNKTTWFQLSLILFVALVITVFLFRLETRTSQLEASLSTHDESMLDSIDSYRSELSPGIRSIKKTLKAVKQELDLIKASTVSETQFDNPVVSESSVNEQFQQPSGKNSMSIMEDEILALKTELKIAKNKLNAITANKGRHKNLAVDKKATVTTAAVTTVIATTEWVVNLASFTHKNKADKALEPLYAVGLSPLIQQVNVNGKRLYRLIIDGFSSQAEAKLFVHRAGDEFGLAGGWVRKS